MSARDSKMEKAIRAKPDEADGYLVYADWLQAKGSPQGELITVQHALEAKKKDKKLAGREKQLIQALALPKKELATFGWRWGFFDWVRLENRVDWMDNTFDAVGLARSVFGLPMCAVLRELRLGVLRWDKNHEDVPAVLAEAAVYPWAATVKKLRLGDVDHDVDMAHHVIGPVGPAVSKAFPKLEELFLHSGSQGWHGKGVESFSFEKLALPSLRKLTIETCAMTKKRLAALWEARLPKLESLEVWFGDPEHDAEQIGMSDLSPLLDGKVLKGVKSLALKNAAFTDELVRALPSWKIAKRLESLDVSKGVLGDEAAQDLAAAGEKKGFPALKSLNVDESFLGAAMIKRLAKAFGFAVSGKDQKEPYDEEGERYVSVHE